MPWDRWCSRRSSGLLLQRHPGNRQSGSRRPAGDQIEIEKSRAKVTHPNFGLRVSLEVEGSDDALVRAYVSRGSQSQRRSLLTKLLKPP